MWEGCSFVFDNSFDVDKSNRPTTLRDALILGDTTASSDPLDTFELGGPLVLHDSFDVVSVLGNPLPPKNSLGDRSFVLGAPSNPYDRLVLGAPSRNLVHDCSFVLRDSFDAAALNESLGAFVLDKQSYSDDGFDASGPGAADELVSSDPFNDPFTSVNSFDAFACTGLFITSGPVDVLMWDGCSSVLVGLFNAQASDDVGT